MPVDSPAAVREILAFETIAVVGCSSTPGKAAHDVPAYLDEHGYDVIPVNPFADEILGREAADSLSDVEASIDVVCLFRPSEEVPEIVEAALERDDVEAIWMQLGIRHEEAATRVERDGRRVVQDRCMKVDHRNLVA